MAEAQHRDAEHPLVALARQAVETYVCEGRVLSAPNPLPECMQGRRGTFVSLHRQGALRGCIGTIEPTQPSIAAEIIANAVASASRDPRFRPVTPGELADLEISVDVLAEPEPIASWEELDPRTYGVIVESGRRRGLLLPDLEGVDTVAKQVAIALQKASISPRDPYRLYRFRVERYH